jgi:hypothetical protein
MAAEAILVLEIRHTDQVMRSEELVKDMRSVADDIRTSRMSMREILENLTDILCDPERQVTATLRMTAGGTGQGVTETVALR